MLHAVRRLVLLPLLAALPVSTAHAGETGPLVELLLADFENQAVNAPIGTGGAKLGEPVSWTAENRVIEFGIDGRGLIMSDVESYAVSMRFEFLEDREMSEGRLYLSVWLRVHTMDTFFIRLRENGSSTTNYGEVMLTTDGALRLSDATGNMGEVVAAGAILPDGVHQIEWMHDLDAGTHSLLLDGEPLVEDRIHGQDGGEDGRGIGAVLFGFFSGPGPDGVIEIDSLEVYTDLVPLGDAVFTDGFEAIEPLEATRAGD